MALTPFQLKYLRFDLIGLGDIKYDDVVDELLDHYASLTERKIDAGMSFEEASKWAWAELGSGEGLQRIQTDYEKSIKAQVRTRHLEILKSYFRWPAFIATALVGALMYLLAPFIPAKGMLTLFYLFGFAPTLVVIYGLRRNIDQHTDSRKIIWSYFYQSYIVVNIIFWHFGAKALDFLIGKKPLELFQFHSTIGLILCMANLLYAISFIQLFKENFSLKLA